jgi:hypothetical protein
LSNGSVILYSRLLVCSAELSDHAQSSMGI